MEGYIRRAERMGAIAVITLAYDDNYPGILLILLLYLLTLAGQQQYYTDASDTRDITVLGSVLSLRSSLDPSFRCELRDL